MIYLSKYQDNPSPEPVGTGESSSMSPERSCGGIEEVSGKKNTQTLFNPITLLNAKHTPIGKFLLPVMTIAFLLILLLSSSTVTGGGGTATCVVTFMPVASLAGDNPVMIGERKIVNREFKK